MRDRRIQVRKRVMIGALKYRGVELLTYKIQYPDFISLQYRECTRKLNRIYMHDAYKYKRYCETDLFNTAVEQYKESKKHGYPVRVFDVMQVYTATYSRDCAISLYFDRYEYTGGAHGNTVRQSQTWQLQECELVKLDNLVTCQPDFKTYILTAVNAQIEAEPDIYFENYSVLAADTFNAENFYCTPEGVVIYYQQYDIAPYSSGIREFLIPYGECVMDPADLCIKS